MRTKMVSFLRKALADQSGQSVVILVGSMLSLCAMAGLTLDVGHAYSVRTQLQNSVNAAGLAAAGYIYNKQSADLPDAVTEAKSFASQNPIPGLTPVTTSSLVCRNVLQNAGWTCATNPTSNALVVTETVSVPTTFMRIFGFTTMNVSATATASMQSSQLWNFAIIEDLTGSMGNSDSSCTGLSEFACTQRGIQEFLENANPCPTGVLASDCTTSNANLRVALFGFPNVRMDSDVDGVSNFQNCSGKTWKTPAPFEVFTLPLETATSYAPMAYHYNYSGADHTFTASYELTYGATDADENGFVSDWYLPTSAATGKLNPSSKLVQMLGYTPDAGSGGSVKTGCLKLQPNDTAPNGAVTPPAAGGTTSGSTGALIQYKSPNPGLKVNTTNVSQGTTYLASVIYAAQAALTAEQALMKTKGLDTSNAIILQSDGDQNTQWIYFPEGLVTQAPPATTAEEPITGKYQNNFKGYNLPTKATIDPTKGYSLTSSVPDTGADVAYELTGKGGPAKEATGARAAGTAGARANPVQGMYPDFLDECQQTIIAAQTATKAGTRFYGIAYGASTTTGCSSGGGAQDYTDVTLLPSSAYPLALNVSFTTLSSLHPCVEMQNVASSLEYFYSYFPSGTSNACTDSIHTTTTLADVWSAIGASVGKPHLIPNTAK